MTKFKRIINGECSIQMIELFDDAEKAANTKNEGELVECKIENFSINFTKVTKEHDGRHQDASAKAEGSSSEETPEVPRSETKSK